MAPPPWVIDVILGGPYATPMAGRRSKRAIYDVCPHQSPKKRASPHEDEALVFTEADSLHISQPPDDALVFTLCIGDFDI